MDDWRDREATNETIFRELNEWTQDAGDDLGGTYRSIDTYICECSDPRCTDPISLSRQEYEAVRAVPIRFAIALNHENPEIDRVLVENERFATVEKFFGPGARIARSTDPRR